MSRRRGARSAWALLLLVAFLSLGGVACPRGDLLVEITERGADTLVDACAPPPCEDRPEAACVRPCAWSEQDARCRNRPECSISSHEDFRQEGETSAQFLLVSTRVKASQLPRSACFSLSGCEPGPTFSACLAALFRERTQLVLADGLTFDDFESTDQGALMIAVFQSDTPESCAIEDLVACAGLAPPLNAEKHYDITCASCQGRSAQPEGVDTGACPRGGESCFLAFCKRQLEKAAGGE
jgi:hypothetical protein